MQMLIVLWAISWVWLAYEIKNAPILDDETGRFIYKTKKGW